jgi:hypothetical protein
MYTETKWKERATGWEKKNNLEGLIMIPKEHTKHESFIEARTSKIIFNKTLST